MDLHIAHMVASTKKNLNFVQMVYKTALVEGWGKGL